MVLFLGSVIGFWKSDKTGLSSPTSRHTYSPCSNVPKGIEEPVWCTSVELPCSSPGLVMSVGGGTRIAQAALVLLS